MQLLFPGYYVCYYVGYYIGYYVGYYIGYYVMLLFIPVKTGGPYPRLRDFYFGIQTFEMILLLNNCVTDTFETIVPRRIFDSNPLQIFFEDYRSLLGD